jgi:hypothetical protein
MLLIEHLRRAEGGEVRIIRVDVAGHLNKASPGAVALGHG